MDPSDGSCTPTPRGPRTRTRKQITLNPSPPGRSILDYSIVGCFVLIFLLVLLLLDAYEYVTVPGASSLRAGGRGRTIDSNVVVSARDQGAIMEAMTASASKEDLEEAKRDIDAAKDILAKTRAEVEIVVGKVDDHLKEVKTAEAAKSDEKPVTVVETPKEAMQKEVKKEELVEAMVEKELGIDKWCGTCIWNNFAKCDRRKEWLMAKYKITEVVAKEGLKEFCFKK
jgi:hypothetical protein